MTDSATVNPPSPFIARWAPRLFAEFGPHGRALDVATGRGRHALCLAAAGLRVTGLDIQLDALMTAGQEGRASREGQAGLVGNGSLALACVDLTRYPLPRERFEVVVVSRYLDRALFASLREALVPGGILLYETFTERQLQHGRGPRSRAHLLEPGELRMLVRGMYVLFDEEVSEPDALARIAARRV